MFMLVVLTITVYSIGAIRRALAARGPTALETSFEAQAATLGGAEHA